jgi:hypothetical protein
MEHPTELKVFITTTVASCSECGEQLGRGAWVTLVGNKGALCLSCADLAHLTFLPSGDAALTRCACRYSTLVAVVLKWNRAHKRYERQGLLVESKAWTKPKENVWRIARHARGAENAKLRAKKNSIASTWSGLPRAYANFIHDVPRGKKL